MNDSESLNPYAEPRRFHGAAVVGLLLAAAMVLGAILLLPRFLDAIRVLARGTPPPGLLAHRQGRVVGSSDCYWPASSDGSSAMQVTIEGRNGLEIVTIPCLDDRRVLAAPGQHVLGVDLDPRPARAGRVYQVTLDGRTLLSADTLAERRRHDVTMPALAFVVATLAAFSVAGLVLGWLLVPIRLRAPRDALQ